ncbi:MFS transporter [Wukongibacter baidiensis]|uniref:MFS transporter n=1 Tax=Wukongibacter baidiensis TaxID=1723361 RepID=UPI003D7FC25B
MNKRLSITILSLSLLTVMVGATVAPVLGVIKEVFKGVDPLYIKLILTLPAIILIPFSIMSGKLAQFYSKKKIIIIGLSLYIIGGIGGGFTQSIVQLLAFRAVLGMGIGLILPLSTGLIADYYNGNQRTKMMGYSTAVNNLGGIIATLLSGVLAAISWRYAFAVYLTAGIVFVLVVFFLKELPMVKKERYEKRTINSAVWKIAFGTFIVSVIFYAVPTNLSLFLAEFSLGQSGTSSIFISLLTFSSFIVGMLFFKITKLLKNLKVVISLIIMLIGFVILSFTVNIIFIGFAIVCVGIGSGLLLPTFMLQATMVVPKNEATFALAIVSSSMFLGQFSSPILSALVQNLLNSTSTRVAFYTSSLLSIISIVVMVIRNSKKSSAIEKIQRNSSDVC